VAVFFGIVIDIPNVVVVVGSTWDDGKKETDAEEAEQIDDKSDEGDNGNNLGEGEEVEMSGGADLFMPSEGRAKLEDSWLITHVRGTWVGFRPTCRKNLPEGLFCNFLKLHGDKLPILKLWSLN
jgi:hypothetical protein